MRPSTHTLRKHLTIVAVAFLLEVAVYAITVMLPANKGSVILIHLLLPGTILQFFVGGGMSMVDGLAPEWRTDWARVSAATGLTYGCCVLVATSGVAVSLGFLRATRCGVWRGS